MAGALTFAIDVELGSQAEELARTLVRYPCLRAMSTDTGFVLQGTFPILHEGQEIDAFSVRIALHRGGDAFAAVVYETAGRIPRSDDRHVYAGGAVCVALPEDVYLHTRGMPLKLTEFLDGPVRSFFLAQVAVEQGGYWPFGDRRHGADGLGDFYEELLGTRDLRAVQRFLRVLGYPKPYRQWVCPCGSGRKLRRCHAAQISALRRRMDPLTAARFLDRVRIALAPGSR